MKKIVLIVATLCLFSASAVADPNCVKLSGLAETIMELRQAGAPAEGIIQATDNSALTEMLVISAYSEPRYTTYEYKKSAISDFKNKWYISCLKLAKNK